MSSYQPVLSCELMSGLWEVGWEVENQFREMLEWKRDGGEGG